MATYEIPKLHSWYFHLDYGPTGELPIEPPQYIVQNAMPMATFSAIGEHATDEDPFVDYEDDVPLARANGFTRVGRYERTCRVVDVKDQGRTIVLQGTRIR